MTRKKERGIKTTSKKTGAIITVAFLGILAASIIFMVLAWGEAEKLKQQEAEWCNLSQEEKTKDLKDNPQQWKISALQDENC